MLLYNVVPTKKREKPQIVDTTVRCAAFFFGCSMYVYIDLSFVLTISFLWKVSLITAVSSVPLYIAKALRSYFAPASYAKYVFFFLVL
jgi:hypothetical protein